MVPFGRTYIIENHARITCSDLDKREVLTFFSTNFCAKMSPSANPVMDVSDFVRIGCVSSKLMYAAQRIARTLPDFFSPSSLEDDADEPSGGSLLFPPPCPPLRPSLFPLKFLDACSTGACRAHHTSRAISNITLNFLPSIGDHGTKV